MSKHNKKRNTGFIYEALVREVVKQSVDNNKEKRNRTIAIIKECFHKSSLLYQDLHLYKSIVDTENVSSSFAIKVLNEVKNKKNKINKKALFMEQSRIISKINKNVSSSVFANYVPNYKYLASIGMLFNDSLKPKQKVLLEEKLLESMTAHAPGDNTKQYKADGMVINSFLKRFNETYSIALLSEQRELLNKYINSTNAEGLVEFKLFIDREIKRLREALEKNKDLSEVIEDKSMYQKFDKVRNFLHETEKHSLDESFILKITQVQQLVSELTAND